MKTKIRTLLTICALAFIGLIDINAISDNRKNVNSEVVSEKVEMLTNESWMSEKNYIYSADTFSSLDLNNEIDEFESSQYLPEESLFTDDAFIYSAREFSAYDIENEIENHLGEQSVPELDKNELSSAESFTASGADLEIEKYAQKQVAMQQIRTGN